MNDYVQFATRVQQDVRELERKIEDAIVEFRQKTDLPVYLSIEDLSSEPKQIGRKNVVNQRVRVSIIL